MSAQAPWPYPRWIAHRGAGRLAPENTMAAFRLGAAHGFRAFECDVKLSSDGVPFLLHDATLERTTSGVGPARIPWAELQRLDAGAWLDARHAGEPLPRLDDVADWLIANDHRLNLEIKPIPGHDEETGRAIADRCAHLWRGRVPPLLSSFRPAALAGARAQQPQLPRALLLDALREGWLDEARALGCVAVVMQHRLMQPHVLGALRTAGLRALCYTVNDAPEVDRLLVLGIDGIITDAVDRFAPDGLPPG